MRVVPLLVSLILLAAVIDLVRRRRLREEFSWLWVVGAAGALVLGAWEDAREAFARAMGVDEGMAVIALGVIFLVLIALDVSTKVSRLANHQKSLAQSVGRLEKRVSDLEQRPPDDA